MSDLGTLDGGVNSQSFAYGINASGQIVGQSSASGGAGNGAYHAFSYSGGIMTDLNSLLPVGSGWNILELANAINDSGQIVGSGSINRHQHAFLYDPRDSSSSSSPEPASVALFGTGAAFLVLMRKKLARS